MKLQHSFTREVQILMQSAGLQVGIAQKAHSVCVCIRRVSGKLRKHPCVLERRHSAREALWEHSGVCSQQVPMTLPHPHLIDCLTLYKAKLKKQSTWCSFQVRGRDNSHAVGSGQEHKLHKQVHIRMRLLRIQQGADCRGAARGTVPAALLRSDSKDGRGVGSRRHRSVHAGRHPPRLHW